MKRVSWFRVLPVLIAGMTIGLSLMPAANAAVPRCLGRRPTIVGTARADRIKGTSRADVIVGLAATTSSTD